MTNASADHDDEPSGRRFPRWLMWSLLGVLAVVVVGYGAIFLYAKVLNDSPDELDSTDLDAALQDPEPSDDTSVDTPPTTGATSPATTASPVTAAPSTTASPSTTGAPTVDGTTAPADSSWATTDASELGYRVKEILFGVDADGVGRTNQVDGAITISGTQVTSGDFTVDVASITSDESRRDGQFRGRIMSTDEFPEATFVLTEPIELGTEPVDGAQVATTATGELTLRGVTNEVTFDVEARLDNGRIGVLGNIPVVFADYGIDNPSSGGITTEDNGLLEFVLVFEPA